MPHKIINLEINSNQNSKDLDKIKRIFIEINTENFSKNFIEFPILINQPVFSIDGTAFTPPPVSQFVNIVQIDRTHWEVLFQDLPEYMIPMFNIKPIFFSDAGVNWNNTELTYDFNYVWENIDSKNYKLYIRLSGVLQDSETFDDLDLYATLSCWFINLSNRDSVQHNLGL